MLPEPPVSWSDADLWSSTPSFRSGLPIAKELKYSIESLRQVDFHAPRAP